MDEPALLAPACAEEPLTPAADAGADAECQKSMLARRGTSSKRMSSFLLASGGAAEAEDVAHEGVDKSRAELLFDMLDVDGDKRVCARRGSCGMCRGATSQRRGAVPRRPHALCMLATLAQRVRRA
jgi:hypothetical protein